MKCEDVRPRLEALVDGEVDRLRARRLAAHLSGCAPCAAAHDDLEAWRAQMKAELPRHAAPAELRARIARTLAAAVPPQAPAARKGRVPWFAAGAFAGSVATVVAFVAVTALHDQRSARDTVQEAVNSHVRATLAAHAVQVASSDQHTVKPWLAARLDYSPPVRDFAAQGFPLQGGRIDYLDGRAVATLVYRHRDHMIDVFVRPTGDAAGLPAPRGIRGFNVVAAAGQGMDWLAVSDLNAAELSEFTARVATAIDPR